MLNINSVSDLLQLSMFKDSESTPCQVYNSAGECCFCGFFDEVVYEYGNAVLRDVDMNSGMFFISLG